MNRILITLKYFMLQSFCFVSLSFFIFNSAHAQSLSEPSADALPPQVQGHRTESTTNIDTPIIFENIYHHHSDWHGAGAHDLQVEMKLIGGSVMGSVKFLSKNAVAPMSYNNGSPQYYIDALGSSNIELVINEEVGYAEYAGLHFKQAAIVNIWKNGIIEINNENIEGIDTNGVTWISKKTKVDNDRVAIIMVKQKK